MDTDVTRAHGIRLGISICVYLCPSVVQKNSALVKLPSIALALSAFGLVAFAAESAPTFNRDIRPILSDNCFNCHGSDTASRKGGLRLDERDAALKGGKSGAHAIVPGKPAESELLLRVRSPHEDEAMPPPDKKPRLAAADIAKLERWIAGGAKYEAHWSFVAPVASAAKGKGSPILLRVSRSPRLRVLPRIPSTRWSTRASLVPVSSPRPRPMRPRSPAASTST